MFCDKTHSGCHYSLLGYPNTNLNTPNKTTTTPNSTTTKALAPNLNTTNQLNTQAKDIDIQAGYNGSLNESYHKTSGLSLGGLVGIGPLYTSTCQGCD
jgi:hypothetical protein